MLPIKTILHPTDFSEQAEYAFRVACALARDYGANLVVAHVMSLPMHGYSELGSLIPEPAEAAKECWAKLSALRPPAPDHEVEYRLCSGDPADEIVRLARKTRSNVIVMATHGRAGLGRLFLGSVAEQVLRQSPCPVLLMRKPFLEDAPVAAPSAEELAHV
jgi:nucleotide-binding universal stress UspA family protein